MDKKSRLNNRQIKILKDYFAKSIAGATVEEVAKEHGIARKTLSTWKNSDHGKQLHAEFQKEISVESMPTFFRVLDEKVAKGNKDAMNLYARIHNLIAPTKQEITTKNETNHNIVKEGVSADELKHLEALLKGESPIKRVK